MKRRAATAADQGRGAVQNRPKVFAWAGTTGGRGPTSGQKFLQGGPRSWGAFPIWPWHGLARLPDIHQSHRFVTARTGRRLGLDPWQRWIWRQQFVGQLPGDALARGEQGNLSEQRAHPVERDFGRRMQPAKETNPGKVGGQNMLRKTADKLIGLEFQMGPLASGTVFVWPADTAVGQEVESAVGAGSFKDIASQVGQSHMACSGGFAMNDPALLPHFGRDQLK